MPDSPRSHASWEIQEFPVLDKPLQQVYFNRLTVQACGVSPTSETSTPCGKGRYQVNELLPSGSIDQVDPEISELIKHEAERQNRKLIMIASESICPPAVRRKREPVTFRAAPKNLILHIRT